MAITTVKIYPSIGIARLGNSPTEFFIGPEIPGVRTPPAGGYKDAACRIKRQAARFRLYGFDENGDLVQEITKADATITWTAHLANTKSEWKRFDGPNPNASLRNSGVADRSSLKIDPGPRTLNGPNQAAGFNTGTFLGKVVPLGEMRTDADGRLLILGGFGSSGSVPAGLPIPDYANNDGWHDDVSDGPVTAKVTLNGTVTPIDAVPAWVLCVPPDFAPPLESITSLYDTLLQVAVDKGLLPAPGNPSFSHDVFPILRRVLALQRVNQDVASAHSSFTAAFPPGGTPAQRTAIFDRIRNPNNPNGPAAASMPLLFDDSNQKRQTITKLQYSILEKWKNGTFTDDWTGSPPPPPGSITPDGLSRAALEACVGAAFFPGIEASWFLRDTFNYTEPFRLNHTGRAAGDVTKQMAVPWQADFYECLAFNGYAWWPAQRPDDVFPEGGGGPVLWTRDIIRPYQSVGFPESHKDMVNHWHKLGFIVDKGGQLVETERHVVCTSLFLITDRSHFSEDEVAGALMGGTPAKFEDSLYVVAQGFLPAELGVVAPNPTPAQLAAGIAPKIDIVRNLNNLPAPGMKATPQKLLLEDSTLPPGLPQRFTFVYRIEFDNVDSFSFGGNPVESQTLALTATKGTFTSAGVLTLFHQPNPYMLDGPVSWLSTDVRVFKVTQGQSPFGAPVGAMGNDAAAASSFINAVVDHFNSHAPAGHPFDGISTDQNTSALELSEQVGGQRVFNFAVARVRYRAAVLDAPDVRVFFRLFTTAATGLDYDMTSTYRRTAGPAPISLLGLQGGKLVTIPCFGDARVDTTAFSLATQTDNLNKRTLEASGADEFQGYFGCWLDINQTTARFPIDAVPADGPWAGPGVKSIQQLIRGMHQCLVAEVHFDKDPVPQGASPGSNDNLAQRNLAIVESDNPGSLATHTVQHTFEIKAALPMGQTLFTARAGHEIPGRTLTGPDELMILWNNLPRETRVTLYMPDVDADEVLRTAGQSYEAKRLERVDAHTLLCLPGDVTYVPLPMERKRNTAALLTLELPDFVRRQQSFQVVVRQVSGRPRAVIGSFQLSIPVSDKSVLLRPEIRKLAVLRHIFQAIPADDPWSPVFVRYLDQIADRVRGFGGNPDEVPPSPDGGEGGPEGDGEGGTPSKIRRKKDKITKAVRKLRSKPGKKDRP
jgi:hypothetical protein